MNLPDIPNVESFIPDKATVELMQSCPALKLAAGEKFIARVNSVVIHADISKAIGKLMQALLQYLPFSFGMVEAALYAALEPITDADKADIRKMIEELQTARQDITSKFAPLLPKE